MKKIYLLVCIAMMSVSAANAKLIFQESFDDPNGTVGTLCAGATNTTDFFDEVNYEQTRWWSYSGSSNYIKVEEGTLSYPGYQTEGFGNKAYLWSTGADDVRSFASQNVTSGKVYLSAIINVEAVKQKADADYFLSLGDHANSYFLGCLFAKSVKEDDIWTGFKLGIAKNGLEGGSYLRYSDEVFAPGKDILVVIEYEFVAGEKNDIARLYINPTKETTEPTIECVQDTVTGGGIAKGAKTKPDAGIYGLFGVFLRQGSNTPKVFVDEIKVATAWEDIWVEKSEEEIVDDSSVDDLAALQAAELYKNYLLKSEPVVVRKVNENVVLQDASGAVTIDDFFDSHLLKDVKVGDKLNNLTLSFIDSKDFINGLPTARLSTKTTPVIVSSDNSVEPFEVTLANADAYGPACVKINNVSFAIGAEKHFTEGLLEISQDEIVANLNIPVGCDIIGEDIPTKATVKALVTLKDEDGLRLQIGASADITDRIAAGDESGIEGIQTSAAGVQKELRDGQLILIRDGKRYSASGVEIR